MRHRHKIRRHVPGALATTFSLLLLSCSDEHLRGRVSPSADGQTYLVIVDDGHVCTPVHVDGEAWPVKLDEAHPVRPGVHQVSCGDEDSGIGFEIPEGTTFYFDYWGP